MNELGEHNNRTLRDWRLRLVVALLLGLIALTYSYSPTAQQAARGYQPGAYEVVHVDDGDTITIKTEGGEDKVRLIGIDTPELHHPQKPVQCFAEAARGFAANLIGTGRVRLVADELDDNRDLYGRLLRYVYLPDGRLLNAEIVGAGYGFAYTHFPFTKKEEMQALEAVARQEGRGLWSSCKIIVTNFGPETQPAP